jgi:putative colanic acid biosynthesis UDP-glucose lipid carrier transferase
MNDRGLIRPHEAELGFLARLTDGAWILFAMFVANQIYREPWTVHNSLAVIIAIGVFYLAAETTGLFRSDRGRPFRTEMARVWSCWGVAIVVLLFVAFVTKTYASYSRVVSLVWFALAPISLSLWRAAVEVVLREVRTRGYNSRKVAVVGVTEVGERFALHLKTHPRTGVQLIGFFDDREKPRAPTLDPTLGHLCGNIDQLVERAHRGEVDHIYIALSLKAEPRIKALLQRLSDTTASVYLVYDSGGFNALNPQWKMLGDTQVLSVIEKPFIGVNGWTKRLEDIVLGSLTLIIIAVPMFVIAVSLKLASRGRVFSRQHQ